VPSNSRQVEEATFDDVGARVICGGLHPDHSTVAEFVRRNAGAVLGLLPQSVKACAREGLVDLSVVAGDGTKLKANAAMAANLTLEQLDAQVSELEGWIAAELRDWVRDILGDDGAPPPGGDDGGSGGSPAGGDGAKKKWKQKPPRAQQVLESRLEARGRLEARRGATRAVSSARVAELARVKSKEAAVRRHEGAALARVEARAAKVAAGRDLRGAVPLPAGQDREVIRSRQALAVARARARHEQALAGTLAPLNRKKKAGTEARPETEASARRKPKTEDDLKVNPSDPSSRVMPLKKGGYDQLFNVQALATAGTQVILAVTRHDNPADAQALLPLLAEARRVLAAAGITSPILAALFDTGYASDANFTAAVPETLYVAVTREGRQAARDGKGRGPSTLLPSWQDMTARLDTPEGKKLYKQRSATIEPVFAQLTARLGRTLSYRGDLADAELALWAASHNILKAITARAKPAARQPATATLAAA